MKGMAVSRCCATRECGATLGPLAVAPLRKAALARVVVVAAHLVISNLVTVWLGGATLGPLAAALPDGAALARAEVAAAGR